MFRGCFEEAVNEERHPDGCLSLLYTHARTRMAIWLRSLSGYQAVPCMRRYDLYLHCAFSCAAANNSSASFGNCFATEAKRNNRTLAVKNLTLDLRGQIPRICT